jgi:hypothetical protein
MTLEQLAHQIAQLRLGESRPVAIWFIDRYGACFDLLKEQRPPYTVASTSHHLTFYGLRMHTCSSETTLYFLEGAYYATPFYQKPGVWIEVSDGNHVRLQDDQ